METIDQAPGSAPTRRRSSRGCLWLVLGALAVLVLVCTGLCAVGFFVVFGVIKSSEPYRMALEQVQQDPQVIERLGQPIEDATLMPTGEVQVEGDQGTANLHFTVEGPQGTASVSAQARRVGGQWGLTTLAATFENGDRLNLDPHSDEGLDEAPRWPPP